MIMSIKSIGDDCKDFSCIFLCTELSPENAIEELNNIYLDDIIHSYGEKVTDVENPFGFKHILFN
jgi:hypothetical protein